jgi:hypothetical protein
MDQFFEIPNPIAEPPPSPEPDEPPWLQPPRDVIAGLVGDRRVIARTDRLVVLLTHIDAFPTGAMLRLRIMGRRPNEMSESDWWDFHETVMGRRLHPGSTKAVPDEFLRIGVEFPDGRKATNISHAVNPDPRFPRRAPAEPSLVQLGGGGAGWPRSFAVGRNIWLWPLPPADTFDLVIEWPAYGIPVTRVPIEGGDIVAASLHTEPAW